MNKKTNHDRELEILKFMLHQRDANPRDDQRVRVRVREREREREAGKDQIVTVYSSAQEHQHSLAHEDTRRHRDTLIVTVVTVMQDAQYS